MLKIKKCNHSILDRHVSRFVTGSHLKSTLYRVMSAVLLAVFMIAIIACDDLNRTAKSVTNDLGMEYSGTFTGISLGQACNEETLCRRDLICESGTCKAQANTALEDACIVSAECQEGLKCGWSGFCIEAGEKQLGESCGFDAECVIGSICQRSGGLGGECVKSIESELGLDQPCDEDNICAEGLICSPQKNVCLPNSLLLNPDAFRGVECDEEAELLMPFGARHTLPHENADFFSTPFPSDLHMSNGKLDLRNYPVPGNAFSDTDLFDQLLRKIEKLRSAWSRNPGIFFRFTRAIQPEQILEQADLHLKLIDLDSGEEHPFSAQLLNQRNKYICGNALAMHPLWSRPLHPGHRYAALVLKTIRSVDLESPQKLDAFIDLLNSRAPREDVLRSAWLRYAPLREWLNESNSITANDIIGATVFTVRDRSEIFVKGREAVLTTAQIPSLVPLAQEFDGLNAVLCQEGTRSPCATPNFDPTQMNSDSDILEFTAPEISMIRDPRDCPTMPHPAFHEIHAKIKMPVFQSGERPYQDFGGDVLFLQNMPQVQDYEDVCLAITVPKTESPEEGWPSVIYAHGTNGSFRSGPKLIGYGTSVYEHEDRMAGMVTFSIDQVMHGNRIGEDRSLSPGPLFFNIQNPTAARGNLIQGALDQFALVRFIKNSNILDNWDIEGLGVLPIDRRRISYHGHSQGGTVGPLFAPFEDDIKGVVLSGTAGGLLFSLLGKKKPYDSTVGLRLTLQEVSLKETHPALHIFQEFFDDVDPINYADRLYTDPHGKPIHALQIMGQDDGYTPYSGQRSFAGASGGTVGIPQAPFATFDGLLDFGNKYKKYPLIANINADQAITGVIVQYIPEQKDGINLYDGHFVAYQNQVAYQQLLKFLGDLSLGNTPKVIGFE